MLRVGHAHHRQPCSLLLCKTVLHRGHPTGWSATNRFGQADIRDHHLFDFQLVASDYTDCPLRYTRLSSILSQKAGHNTCHLQVHQKLMLPLKLCTTLDHGTLRVGIRVSCHISHQQLMKFGITSNLKPFLCHFQRCAGHEIRHLADMTCPKMCLHDRWTACMCV